MEFFPAPLENLVEQFARLPGIGSKSAQRLAFHVLNLPQDQARAFADAILEAKRSVTLCPVCQNLTSGGLCPICASPKRDESTICVVADPGMWWPSSAAGSITAGTMCSTGCCPP